MVADGGLKGWPGVGEGPRREMISADEEEKEKKTRNGGRGDRQGRGMMFRGPMQSAAAADCLAAGSNDSCSRHCLCLFARCRRTPLTIMHSLLRRQIIRS